MIANNASRILSVYMFNALHLTSSNLYNLGLVGLYMYLQCIWKLLSKNRKFPLQVIWHIITNV